MYKVLKEIVEDKESGFSAETNVSCLHNIDILRWPYVCYLHTIPPLRFRNLEHGLPETILRPTFLDAFVMATPRTCLRSNCRG